MLTAGNALELRAQVENESCERAFDASRARLDFPILRHRIRGREIAYLDNAATTQKPQAVIDAEMSFYTSECSNVHRGVHTLSQRATASFESSRDVVRDFVGASDRKEIIFTRGTTEAINLVAQSFARPRLQPGDEVLITEMEHHSDIVPWQLVCQERGAVLRVVPVTDSGELELEAFHRLLGPRTRLVGIVHVSNALGTINPVRDVVRAAHDRGAVVLVDGAQAVAHIPVDVQELGCDFYAFSGHKLYGPTGIGVLYGKRELLESMPPYQGGGDMILSVTFAKTTYNELPYKFEAGTPNIAGAIGLGAAIRYLGALPFTAVMRHEDELLRMATEALSSLPGLRVIGTARRKTAVLSFVLEGVHPHDIGTIIDLEGVAIRTGHHCAQPLMERFGLPATARASFGLYNTISDVEALYQALQHVEEIFR
ncbi:MAG: cysteine desulfurase [Candidatus Schekmanbacteria bacterium]|nr:cysteine desulfurase [Candidatus Schekmanbacteria bacterium]